MLYQLKEIISKNVLRTSPKLVLVSSGSIHMVLHVRLSGLKWQTYSGIWLGCSEDVNLIIIQKAVSLELFLFFSIPIVYGTSAKVRIWFVLFWSYYGLERYPQNGTIRGVPQDILCSRTLSIWFAAYRLQLILMLSSLDYRHLVA